MSKLTHSGTDGRTYGGDPNLVHIPDHHRADVGRSIAATLEAQMRMLGALGVGHDAKPMTADDPLCPGCYMIALFDASVVLAERTGQDVRELGASMAQLFAKLAAEGKYQPTEEMTVIQAPAPVAELRDAAKGYLIAETGAPAPLRAAAKRALRSAIEQSEAPAVPCAMAQALERATLPANFGEA